MPGATNRNAERWLLERTLRRKGARWLDVLRFLRETGTLTVLVVVGVLLLGPLSEGYIMLREAVAGNPEWARTGGGALLLLYLIPLWLALDTRHVPRPLAPDRFVVLHSGRAEGHWGRFIGRWAVRSAAALFLLGAAGATIVVAVARGLGLEVPVAPAVLILTVALLFASVPGLSVWLHGLRRGRWAGQGLLALFGIGTGYVVTSVPEILPRVGQGAAVAAILLLVIPLLLLRGRDHPDGEALLRELKLRRALQTARDGSERRAYARELAGVRRRGGLGDRLYARGWGAYTVRNVAAWWNESPVRLVAAWTGTAAAPFLAWRLHAGVLSALGEGWRTGWREGDATLWISFSVVFSLVGLALARLPAAGWRQDFWNPQLRLWIASPLRYVVQNALLSCVFTLAWAGVAASFILPALPAGGSRWGAVGWLLAHVPLWCTLVVYEPWVDSLRSPENAALLPSRSGDRQGALFSMAMCVLPGGGAVVARSLFGHVAGGFAAGAIIAVAVLLWVWRLVHPAWRGE